MPSNDSSSTNGKLGDIVAKARDAQRRRESTYRERALKLFPHVCARCGREFSGKKLRELTVHHKDHNHDYNPPDGSNWELLCLYCHDNEHQRYLEQDTHGSSSHTHHESVQSSGHKPFEKLAEMLKNKS